MTGCRAELDWRTGGRGMPSVQTRRKNEKRLYRISAVQPFLHGYAWTERCFRRPLRLRFERAALLRLRSLSAHALAGLRSCGAAANRALLALSRGRALALNARHALACLGAGALAVGRAAGRACLPVATLLHTRHALACGRVACAYVLVRILRHCNAWNALTALHVGALAFDARNTLARACRRALSFNPRHALTCACGRMLIPSRHVGHVAIGSVPLVCSGRLVRGNARMSNMIVASTCICGECGRCATLLTCWFVLHTFVHERSRGVVLTI